MYLSRDICINVIRICTSNYPKYLLITRFSDISEICLLFINTTTNIYHMLLTIHTRNQRTRYPSRTIESNLLIYTSKN